MTESESKARLIVKRIVAHLAPEDHPMGCEWMSMNEASREGWMRQWTNIAVEVLGEEVETPTDKEKVKRICDELNFNYVMDVVSDLWSKAAPNTCWTIGPARALLRDCDCEEPNDCEWCCGTGLITARVERAKNEHEQSAEPKVKTGEEFDPIEWHNYQMAQHFICSMQSLGATKIEVPASRNGSFSVEFDRGKPPPTPDPGDGDKEDECTP